jgi:hypothetical protein
MEPTTQTWNANEVKNAADALDKGAEPLERTAETVASRVPTLLFSFAALASIGVSLFLQLRNKRQWSLFVGQWVPSFLLFGLYNKISKTIGAD